MKRLLVLLLALTLSAVVVADSRDLANKKITELNAYSTSPAYVDKVIMYDQPANNVVQIER